MQSQFLNVNDTHYQIIRKINPTGWFDSAIKTFGGEEICRQYHVDKLLKDPNGVYFMVNEVKDAEIVLSVDPIEDTIIVEEAVEELNTESI